MDYELIATTTFGIEAITAKELKELGYEDLTVENGKIIFSGDEMDIAICNTHIRTADRILIKIKDFKAESFEELFQGTLAFDWGNIIPIDGKMHVVGKSIKSKLHSVPDCQGIVKKAVVEAMKRKYKTDWFSEDGPVYKIEVAILKDIVTLSIDTTGPGLHKRGYREVAGGAPLKETLAAALVLISKYKGEELLIDPMCGSGTIAIEAALIANNIAPGLNREFVCETWPTMDKEVWEQVRDGARKSIKDNEVEIFGYDIDNRVIRIARENARKAGVDKYVSFQQRDFYEFSTKKNRGYIITNPPYGERMGEENEVEDIYRHLGSWYQKLENWKVFALTSYDNFERCFGMKSTKNRKLYNGKIQCYYYQYYR